MTSLLSNLLTCMISCRFKDERKLLGAIKRVERDGELATEIQKV